MSNKKLKIPEGGLFGLNSDITGNKTTPEAENNTSNKTSVDSNNSLSDINSDINSDIISAITRNETGFIVDDVNSDILPAPKKRARYTDIHERRTYYVTKEHIKMIEKIAEKYNLDRSMIVNDALKLYFTLLQKNNGR